MGIKALVDSIDEVDEKYRDLYTEKNGRYELTGVEGFKTQADIDRIQAGLAKERNDHKATRDRYAFLGNLDTEQVQAMLDKYPELEAAAGGKLDDAAIQKLVEGRLNTATAPLKRDLDKFRKELAERDEVISGYTAKERTRAIHDSVRDAVGKQKGFQGAAVEDAMVFAERMLEVAEDGRVVTRDGVGVTPGVEATVWLMDMQAKKPHWWGPSEGGGAGGSRSHGSTGGNPWSSEAWNMTEQGKILTENRSKAEQLAKAAGTTLGGARPAPRK
ncbi:MAG: hypothetical protein WC340_16710 [Kiritimatiellia bacterium]